MGLFIVFQWWLGKLMYTNRRLLFRGRWLGSYDGEVLRRLRTLTMRGQEWTEIYKKQTETNLNGQKLTATNRNGQKWTETNRNGERQRQKRTEIERKRQKRTERDKNVQKQREANNDKKKEIVQLDHPLTLSNQSDESFN